MNYDAHMTSTQKHNDLPIFWFTINYRTSHTQTHTSNRMILILQPTSLICYYYTSLYMYIKTSHTPQHGQGHMVASSFGPAPVGINPEPGFGLSFGSQVLTRKCAFQTSINQQQKIPMEMTKEFWSRGVIISCQWFSHFTFKYFASYSGSEVTFFFSLRI